MFLANSKGTISKFHSSIPRGNEILSKLLRNELLQEACDRKPVIKAGVKGRISY